MSAAVRWTVRGRVQGVGFRYSTVQAARRLGLVGWVRNLPDGRVEIEAAGTRDQLHQLLEWLHAGGPAGAMVAGVHEEALDAAAPDVAAWERFEIDR